MSPAAPGSDERDGTSCVLSPLVVVNAPELASLALLEHAIEIARLAVLAEHHELIEPEAPPLPHVHPGAYLTHRLFVRAHRLLVIVRQYRVAVSAAAGSTTYVRADRQR